jgi:hypothetical protein
MLAAILWLGFQDFEGEVAEVRANWNGMAEVYAKLG